MLAPIALWLGKSALMQSPIGSFLKGIPPKAWLVLAIIAALIGAVVWHQHAAHKALSQADQSGYNRAKEEDRAAMAKARSEATAWKSVADLNNAKIIQQEKARHDETVAHNHALADALRVRLGASKVHPAGSGGGNLPRPATAAGGSGRPLAPADAGLAGQVCVPAGPLIDYAEQADNDHDARIRIEDAWRRLQQSWPKAGDKKP